VLTTYVDLRVKRGLAGALLRAYLRHAISGGAILAGW
jgi:hypothetical protein